VIYQRFLLSLPLACVLGTAAAQQSAAGGDFPLTDHNGEKFRLADERGKVILLFFALIGRSRKQGDYTNRPTLHTHLLTALNIELIRLRPVSGEQGPAQVQENESAIMKEIHHGRFAFQKL
jgi:hypothetical protein